MFLTKKFNIGLALMLFCIFLAACGPSPEELTATSAAETASAATNTPLPSATPVHILQQTPWLHPKPTQTPVVKSPTPDLLFYPNSTLECIHWSIVDHTYLGDEICIYGLVNYVQPWNNDWFLEFSSSKEDFKVYDVNNYYWPDIEIGECILLKGVVRDGVSYIYLSPFIDGKPTDIYSIDLAACATVQIGTDAQAVEHYNRGVDYQAQGQLDLAIEEYSKAIAHSSLYH